MILEARYVLPIAAPYFEDGAVAVIDDTIAAVGSREEIEELYPHEPVVDYGLAALMPGFVDLHTHLEYTTLRGLVDDAPYAQWKSLVMAQEAALSPRDWEDSALLGGLEALASGITTLADITATGASARAAQELGLRGVIYREIEGMERPLLKGVLDRAFTDIADWESTLDTTRLRIGISPHSVYACHPKLFEAVSEYAADGRPVAMHLAGSAEEYQFVKYGSSMLGFEVREQYDQQAPLWLPTGVSPVRYVAQWGILEVPHLLAIHVTQVDEDDIKLLAHHAVSIAHCPRCNAKLGMGIAPLADFFEAGLRVGLGTDSPAAVNTMGMFAEMNMGLLLQRARSGHRRFFTAAQFLRFATLGGAEALGLEDEVGSLTVGKKADILAIDLTHSAQIPTSQPESAIVHSTHRSDIAMTMVGGRILYKEGDWTCADGVEVKKRNVKMRDKLRR